MEGLSSDISSAIHNPTLNSDICQSEMVRSAEFAIISPDSANSLRNSSCSSDEESALIRIKKRIQRFSESDSGTDKENANHKKNSSDDNIDNVTDGNPKKSTIKYTMNRLDSDSDSSELQTIKNEGQQSRMESKRNKMREKFKNLTSRTKNHNDKDSHDESIKKSEDSDSDISSVDKIKQKIKERILFNPSICDPDTSDDEEDKEVPLKKQKPKHKKPHKSILTSPKPMRISAKQAMENMHKIKSESNRLLREKEVSLPYHRPKPLSLKDILNRKKPACTIDGKVLPIKMNEHQLKEYVLLLEQRQKEMMELCKSDTDEENNETHAENEHISKETIVGEDSKDPKLLDNQLMENNAVNKMEIDAMVTNLNTSEEECMEQNLELDNKETEVVENHDILVNADLTYNASDLAFELINKNTVTINHSAESTTTYKENDKITENNRDQQNVGSKKDSQLISLYYDSEKSDTNNHICENIKETEENGCDEFDKHDISENEIDFDDIDKMIENAEIIEDKNSNSHALIKESLALKIEPKLTGSTGMVIDLDESEIPKKLTGLELLKERFTYFAKMRTPEELERQKEKRIKPGTQHRKLKQELEEKIAEQRSIEWAKRFEEEKQHQIELQALRGDTSDVEEDIDKIEAKLEENNIEPEESTSEEEEEEEEVTDIKENIRKKNPMIDDEAEVTDCDEEDDAYPEDLNNEENVDNECIDDGHNEEEENNSSGESSDEESSDSESEQPAQKKGRILKAFVDDSDDESLNINDKVTNNLESTNRLEGNEVDIVNKTHKNDENNDGSQKESEIKDSQDDQIQLAQRVNSVSDDMFTSQESGLVVNNGDEIYSETQSFSILDSKLSRDSIKNSDTEEPSITNNTELYNFNVNNTALDSETYTENFVPSQITKSICPSQSQPLGEDILALCTGKFYDNEFITQTNKNLMTANGTTEEMTNNIIDTSDLPKESAVTNDSNKKDDGNVLQSILEELHDSELDSQRPKKYFIGKQDKSINKNLLKKKLVIDSDEEGNETNSTGKEKRKISKKKKPENRVLQISDDEEDEEYTGEYNTSDIEEEPDNRVVEYDSEENEIEVKPQTTKKKRKVEDFFEDEAELTSEDEWVGSGDEDEADLDRMEREDGDNDVFHQGKLQKELGQIHMRDVLDQDKREVRLIQELLFEDGDLGDGHRQRKFRWKNADGDEETGTVVDGLTDTQEEEFESEELWRKQRHEREVFLRQMENEADPPVNVNVSLNRTTIIKANLCSKTMSSLLLDVNPSSSTENTDMTDISAVKEKKTTTNVTSPKKGFTIFQQNYHRSLLTRGRGALARLAALATPLAIDDDAPKIGSLGPTNSRNFVFAALTPNDKETKIPKRKADSNADTPRLVKKLKTKEQNIYNKNSLLNHLQF